MIGYLATFALAVASVCLWTVRVATTARGNTAIGAAVAVVEATTHVVAMSHVIGSLSAPLHVIVYGMGVGSGTYAGIIVDTRLRGCSRADVGDRRLGSVRDLTSGVGNQQCGDQARHSE